MAITPEDHNQHREAQTYIVNQFNKIEMRLAGILIEAIGIPKEKKSFGRRILFNNAIIPYSQKFKLLFNLREEMGWDKINSQHFYRLGHIRNQIAHCLPHGIVDLFESPDNGKIEPYLRVMLESIGGNGKLKPTTVKEALEEFKEHESTISNYLEKIEG